MAAIIRMHLTRLMDFSGREARRSFWPWVALQFGLAMAANAVSMMVLIVPAILGADSADIVEQFIGAAHDALIALAGLAVFMVAMLAAAVTRRLHDAGRSGAYGLLPLPFLALGFLLFHGLMSGIMAGEDLRGDVASVFTLTFLNNLVYLGTLAFLGFLLAKPSEVAENRSGPGSGIA